MDRISEFHARIRRVLDDVLLPLCEANGYGSVMQRTEQLWATKDPGGNHTVGPCASLMVQCPECKAKLSIGCDWCCGSMRVTKRVAEAIAESWVKE